MPWAVQLPVKAHRDVRPVEQGEVQLGWSLAQAAVILVQVLLYLI